MKRQRYFPSNRAAEPGWFRNFAVKLLVYATRLALDPEATADRRMDALYSAYLAGSWLTAAKSFSAACAKSLEHLYTGTGAFTPLLFHPPDLPEGVVEVPAGALERLFAFIQIIKNSPGYTRAIGLDLGIEGSGRGPARELPEFTLAVELVDGWQAVRVAFKKFGRQGVSLESRRVDGDWEDLGIGVRAPWRDDRPLLAPGVPEVREYRLRFWHKGSPTGEYTEVQKITVSPG